MILIAHMLFGAAIGNLFNNATLAIIMAFLSHYFLDFIPHVEYNIGNIQNKRWAKSGPDFLRVFADFMAGLALVSLFAKNHPIIYLYALLAIIPDGFSFLDYIYKNTWLDQNGKLHQAIHFFKYKKISNFWRILSQVIIVIISILLLKVYSS